MTDTKAAPKTTTAAVAPKPEAPRKMGGHLLTARIKLLADKEGKTYGKDNNPKRGKSLAKFALYRDGMTVEDAQKAGLTGADLNWDVKHAFISIA